MKEQKILFSAEDTRMDLQQAARALHEHGLLGAYYTTFALAKDGAAMRVAEGLDRSLGLNIAAQLRRRAITEFPPELVKLFPWWEIPRTVLSRANLDERLIEAIYRRSIARFDRHVARRTAGYTAIYAGNGAAQASFLAAKERDATCIYSVRSFDPRFEDKVKQKEFEKFPDLAEPHRGHDETRQRLIERRQEEWELADLIVMHSNVCRDSYAAYGLDVRKVRVLPLGFPEIGQPIGPNEKGQGSALNVLWAGNFTVLKGAHYFIRALETIVRTTKIETRVFGKEVLPKAMSAAAHRHITFKPTIPRTELFAQYQRADVLVLPTLCDAYAMVTAEAMSQGLPVITTGRAGASAAIRSGENGLVVDAGDAGALARALCWCAENRERLRIMGMRARETAASWQWHHYRRALAETIIETLRGALPQT